MTDELPTINPRLLEEVVETTGRAQAYIREVGPEQVRALLKDASTDPDAKAENAKSLEELDVDMAMLMAIHDDVVEYNDLGDRDMLLERMTMLTTYSLRIAKDPKRAAHLIMRLSRMLYNEWVHNVGGDRAEFMRRIASKDPALSPFAPDAMGEYIGVREDD